MVSQSISILENVKINDKISIMIDNDDKPHKIKIVDKWYIVNNNKIYDSRISENPDKLILEIKRVPKRFPNMGEFSYYEYPDQPTLEVDYNTKSIKLNFRKEIEVNDVIIK